MSHPGRNLIGGRSGGRWQKPALNPESEVQQTSAAGRVAWLPTLLAKGAQPLQRTHLRHRIPIAAPARLHLLLLDTSGSMRQGGRLALAKGYAARLIEQAARAGDDVGVLSFGGAGVAMLVPPGPARAAGAARVRQCGGGGGTPLAQALAMAEQVFARRARRSAKGASLLWLLTDGRTLEQPQAPVGAQHVVILDFENQRQALGRCAAWAARWGAEHRLVREGE